MNIFSLKVFCLNDSLTRIDLFLLALLLRGPIQFSCSGVPRVSGLLKNNLSVQSVVKN